MQYLRAGDMNIAVNETIVQLPKDIIMSLNKRGKRNKNFKFEDNSIFIFCTKCSDYHKVYQYEADAWTDVSAIYYRKSVERVTGNMYFGSHCNAGERERVKVDSVKVQGEENKAKTTVFLDKSNADYLNLRSALTNISKADLLNKIISTEKEQSPIRNFLPTSIIEDIKSKD